jgi:hypothetical protein
MPWLPDVEMDGRAGYAPRIDDRGEGKFSGKGGKT